MKNNKITSLDIKELKGLKNISLTFDKPLMAIMGTNGSGKTTIIHALACCFLNETDWGENKKFSYFFTPNPNASWKNSYFTLHYTVDGKDNFEIYRKNADRWAPRYEKRPIRDSIYIGIDSCLPEIEVLTTTTLIKYKSNVLNDKTSRKIISDASAILNKDYSNLVSNNTKTKTLLGVKTYSSLAYSSLSMGSGEQRVIKILQIIHKAPPFSLILIDEIDLLLHPSALYNLITFLNHKAIERNLQIIFTTHSLLMNEFRDIIDIRFLENTSTKTLVYNYMSSDAISIMTGESSRPIKIFVEDKLSSAIIKLISLSLNIKSKIEIKKFGSIENAFTLAAGMVLKQENTQNILVVLDGDRYQTAEEKCTRIEKVLSGTEMDIEEKRSTTLSIITQYNLPLPESSPEYNIYSMLCELPKTSDENEIIKVARRIQAVKDSHDWIDNITKRIDDSSEIIIYEILKLVSTSPKWNSYIEPIALWLSSRIDL